MRAKDWDLLDEEDSWTDEEVQMIDELISDGLLRHSDDGEIQTND